ncbi:Hypothetical_protein [Hexamita inflata]|uniref:Hypothetical_protein n=1 Tax=Hexamita inflata TaxID=28002 RepID=A0AA86NBR6_9EUKA|nr:Hypothetical protein HINF_LOCUS4165 [Hexamita inflata]
MIACILSQQFQIQNAIREQNVLWIPSAQLQFEYQLIATEQVFQLHFLGYAEIRKSLKYFAFSFPYGLSDTNQYSVKSNSQTYQVITEQQNNNQRVKLLQQESNTAYLFLQVNSQYQYKNIELVCQLVEDEYILKFDLEYKCNNKPFQKLKDTNELLCTLQGNNQHNYQLSSCNMMNNNELVGEIQVKSVQIKLTKLIINYIPQVIFAIINIIIQIIIGTKLVQKIQNTKDQSLFKPVKFTFKSFIVLITSYKVPLIAVVTFFILLLICSLVLNTYNTKNNFKISQEESEISKEFHSKQIMREFTSCMTQSDLETTRQDEKSE